MTATQKSNVAADDSVGRRLDVELLDRLMAARGITSVKAQAEAAGVDRSTMFRWRSGELSMGVLDALKLADLAGTTVEQLLPKVAVE